MPYGNGADDPYGHHPAARALRGVQDTGRFADVGPALDPVRDGVSGFGPQQEVPSGVIARLLRETSSSAHGPPVQLAGARITGNPVLDHGRITRPLRLYRCVIDTPIRITGISMAAVELVECVFANVTVEDVDFDGSVVVTGCRGESVSISSSRVSRSVVFSGSEFTGDSPVRIRNLAVGGDFVLRRSVLGNDSTEVGGSVALQAHRLEVGGGLLMPDLQAWGGVDLRGARVGSGIVMPDAEVRGPTDLRDATVGAQVTVSGCRLTGDAELPAFSGDHMSAGAVVADGLEAAGAVVLGHANIRGSVSLSGARIRVPGETSALIMADIVAGRIAADDCEVDGGVWLPGADVRELSLRRVRCSGPLTLEGAAVAAGVKLDGSRFVADGNDRRAISASRIRVGGRIVFGPEFNAEGHIDLAHVVTGKSIDFSGTHLRGRLRLFRAHVGSDLILVGTLIEAGEKEFGVDAIGLRVDGRLTARGLVCDGSVRLTAATADHVVFTGAQLYNPGNVVLSAARIEVFGDLVLGDQLYGDDTGGIEADGRVVLRDARVGGDLVVNEGRLDNAGHRVLDATGASVGGRLALRRLDIRGMVSIDRARIRRRIVLEQITVDGWGVSATRGPTSFTALQTTTDEVLIDACRFTGSARFNGSETTVGVSIRRSTFVSGDDAGEGVALHADDLRCARLALLRVDVHGTLQAARLQVGGDVVANGCTFSNPDRRAFDLTGATIGERLQIRQTFVRGAVAAVRADVGVGVILEHLGIDSAHEGRAGGPDPGDRVPAVGFRGIRVQGELAMSHVRARGEIVLDGGSFGSLHVDTVVSIVPGDRPSTADGVDERLVVIDAQDVEVAGTADLDAFRVEPGDGAEAVVDLSGMHAMTLDVPGGDVVVDLRDARIRTMAIDADDTAHMILEGLEFDDPGRADVTTALAWLRRDPSGFHHQAYEQLAAHYSRKGDDRSARAVRLARQRHRQELLGTRSPGQVLGKVWGFVQDITVGYGYRPGLAAVWFAGLLAFGTIWFWGRTLEPVEVEVHPTFNSFGYTLDLLIPLFSFGQDSAWDPRGADLAVAYGLIFAGAILATTVAAAVTRVLHRR